MVLLTVIALAGASFVQHTRVSLGVQKTRRMAVELANARIEAIRLLPVDAITNAFEVRRLDGHDFPITTQREELDVNGISPTDDCVRITVTVGYRTASDASVSLTTLHYFP